MNGKVRQIFWLFCLFSHWKVAMEVKLWTSSIHVCFRSSEVIWYETDNRSLDSSAMLSLFCLQVVMFHTLFCWWSAVKSLRKDRLFVVIKWQCFIPWSFSSFRLRSSGHWFLWSTLVLPFLYLFRFDQFKYIYFTVLFTYNGY